MIVPILQIDLSHYYSLIGIILGIVVFGTVVWAMSRRFTTLELKQSQAETQQNNHIVDLIKKHAEDIQNLKSAYNNDMSRIQKQHLDDVKALELEIQRQIVERRDDLTKASLQHKEELNNIQKQIESLKSDVKGLLSKIEVAYTSISTGEKTHDEIKDELKTIMHFHSDWNQRIEDTNKETVRMLENTRNELMRLFINCFNKNGNDK